MSVQHDPRTLNNQMDVAATPNELLELAKQVALDVETTREWAAWHTLSIDLAFGLFPETRIELRALGTRSEADDLAQDVFVALRKCWNDYDPGRPLRPYLFGIAFRLAAAHHRKRNRETQLEIIEVTAIDPDPENALQTKQARALVLAALEHVPLPRRAVLDMYDLDEIPVKDIASVLGIPTFTVYSRLRKARLEMGVAVRRLTKARTR